MPQKRCCHGQPGLQPGPQGHRSARAQRRVQGAPEAAAQPQVSWAPLTCAPPHPRPQRCAALTMRIRKPSTTAVIYASGTMARARRCSVCRGPGKSDCWHLRRSAFAAGPCSALRTTRSRATRRSGRADAAAAPQKVTGAKSEALAHRAVRKFARSIQRLGNPVQLKDFMIDSVMATCDVRFPILLESLAAAHPTLSSVRPRRLACACQPGLRHGAGAVRARAERRPDLPHGEAQGCNPRLRQRQGEHHRREGAQQAAQSFLNLLPAAAG